MNKSVKIVAMVIMVFALIPSLFCFPIMVSAEVTSEFYTEDILKNFDSGSVSVGSGGALDINAKSVVLMEPNTKQVLYSNNENEKLSPASITKIMSLLLVMEAIENEKIALDTKVQTSEHAASMGGSQIWLEVGETMTVDELLRASVIASANDATVALAEAVAGSEESFVALMNERAKQLGMKNTNFVNACGLDADNHLTSGLDVAIMASELIKHDLIKKYSTVWMDALRNGKSELVNTNKLVRYYNGATGLKTGTTSKAGCCVAATAERDGMELVAVVMGSSSSNDRFAGAKKLLDYGFANWSFASLEVDLSKYQSIKVNKGMADSITPEATRTFDVLLEKGKQDKVTQKIDLPTELDAPVITGDKIGTATFMLGDKKLGEVPILSANTVEKATFLNAFTLLLQSALMP